LTLTFSGLLNDTHTPPWCSDCVDINGSWVVQKQTEYPFGPGTRMPDGCVWFEHVLETTGIVGVYAIESIMASEIHYRAEFPAVNLCKDTYDQQGTLIIEAHIHWNEGYWNDAAPGRRSITVIISNTLANVRVVFERVEDNQTEPFDCANFDGLVLDYNATESGLLCPSPDATCEVTA